MFHTKNSLKKDYWSPVCAHSVVSNSLWPNGLWPARLLCPWDFTGEKYWRGLLYPSPGDMWDPMGCSTPGLPVLRCLPEFAQTPLSRWCRPTISSSVVPFSCCPQTLPASGSFPMSRLFASGGQSIGVSASTSVLPMRIELISFRMDWPDLLAVQGARQSLVQQHSSSALSLLFGLSH